MIEQIRIEQLEFQARVGVPETERAQPQRLLCNVALTLRTAVLRDDICATVDYAAVAAAVREVASGAAFQLIETLAEKIAAQITQRFQVAKVTVELRKFVLPDAAFVSVTATRGNEA